MSFSQTENSDDVVWPDKYDYRDVEGSDNMKRIKLISKEAIKKLVGALSVKNNVNFFFLRSLNIDITTYYYYKCHHGRPSSKGKTVTYTK